MNLKHVPKTGAQICPQMKSAETIIDKSKMGGGLPPPVFDWEINGMSCSFVDRFETHVWYHLLKHVWYRFLYRFLRILLPPKFGSPELRHMK